MHELLTMGQHPLYEFGKDNSASYKMKLQKAKKITALKDFSTLAQGFFSNLVQLEPLKRYTAKEALQHPWITRSNLAEIPRSLYENMRHENQKDKLKSAF